MLAFLDHPDQWERFKAERPKTFVDEVIRWATPVHTFQRTATRDVELGGQMVRAGDRVCLFYGSANFDEEVFDDPHTFDIWRSPNPHLGFGGSGAHYCLGANLARLEIELIFNAIAEQIPDIRKVDQPERLYSGWVHGIKALPVAYGRPPARRGTKSESASTVVPAPRKPRAKTAANKPAPRPARAPKS
jgi:cholest-4-en-3-one 26-monooxygenase